MTIIEEDVRPLRLLALFRTDVYMKEQAIHYYVSEAKIDHDTIIYKDAHGSRHVIPYASKWRRIYLLPYPFDGDPKKAIRLK